jgi:hypothetical protein
VSRALSEHVSVTDAIIPRWKTLADYAREEIDAYQAERNYIEETLARLESDCRYNARVRLRDRRRNRVDAVRREDQGRSRGALPQGYTPTGYNGSHPLNYNTRDVGPPKLVGDPMLVKLAKPCYAASQGSGNVSFEVKNAW